MESTIEDPWVNAVEAAEYLRTSKKSLYRRVQERQIRHTRDGGMLKFRRSWLDDYLREHEQAPVVLVRSRRQVAEAEAERARRRAEEVPPQEPEPEHEAPRPRRRRRRVAA